MKRMRKEEPSGESQKPETCQDLLEAVRLKSPSKDASVKGLAASGDEREAESSKISKTSTVGEGMEKETSRGAARRKGENRTTTKREAPNRKDFMVDLCGWDRWTLRDFNAN